MATRDRGRAETGSQKDWFGTQHGFFLTLLFVGRKSTEGQGYGSSVRRLGVGVELGELSGILLCHAKVPRSHRRVL